jgi:hypothetical protein
LVAGPLTLLTSIRRTPAPLAVQPIVESNWKRAVRVALAHPWPAPVAASAPSRPDAGSVVSSPLKSNR